MLGGLKEGGRITMGLGSGHVGLYKKKKMEEED
jgi:hypothetical protein